MAKKPANPGEPKPRRTGLNRRRTEKPAESRAIEQAAPGIETANDAPALPTADAPMAFSLKAAKPAGEIDLVPNREEIARRAYEIYSSRGGSHGHDKEDWLQAERELRGAVRMRPGSV